MPSWERVLALPWGRRLALMSPSCDLVKFCCEYVFWCIKKTLTKKVTEDATKRTVI